MYGTNDTCNVVACLDAISARDEAIAERNEEIAELEKALSKWREAIAERDKLIESLYEKLGHKREYIGILERRCNDMKCIIAKQEQDRQKSWTTRVLSLFG